LKIKRGGGVHKKKPRGQEKKDTGFWDGFLKVPLGSLAVVAKIKPLRTEEKKARRKVVDGGKTNGAATYYS